MALMRALNLVVDVHHTCIQRGRAFARSCHQQALAPPAPCTPFLYIRAASLQGA